MKTRVIVAVSLLSIAAPFAGDDNPVPEAYEEKNFVTKARRLTFEGRRAGEGYFSADGTKMVFQSERVPGNPFYQIFELDLTTGETRQISPGSGKTTCSFFNPVNGRIEFASTHLDPQSRKLQAEELERREKGTERRYAWDFDPEMDIFDIDPESLEMRRLTEARGYDAEGSYSPDGEWIVFSSTRSAYERELTDEQTRQLETDPSFFAEIYIMKSDGSGERRLTRFDGYDGGPFFMPDGERIVWRRFDTRGLVADVWTARIDGTDPRQITDFASMSWAPYSHPSGEYIIFTSNKLGFENFELFIVDAEGKKEPVRVSYTDGFDGLPVFTPDGEKLAWTSTRRTKHGQMFMGQWNHARALEALDKAPARTSSR
jgi:Tol biopolymer transport system component